MVVEIRNMLQFFRVNRSAQGIDYVLVFREGLALPRRTLAHVVDNAHAVVVLGDTKASTSISTTALCLRVFSNGKRTITTPPYHNSMCDKKLFTRTARPEPPPIQVVWKRDWRWRVRASSSCLRWCQLLKFCWHPHM